MTARQTFTSRLSEIGLSPKGNDIQSKGVAVLLMYDLSMYSQAGLT